MDISLEGAKRMWDTSLELAIYNNRRMTDGEFRMAVNYGVANGYESMSEIPKEVLDGICNPYSSEFDEYEDMDTRLVSTRLVESRLRRFEGSVVDDKLIEKLLEML